MSMSIGGVILNDPQLPIEIAPYKPSLRTEFESNDVELRQLDTRARKTLVLDWAGSNLLYHSQKLALESFLTSNSGMSFTVVLPFGMGTMTNMYNTEDKLPFKMQVPDIPSRGIVGLWSITLNLAEL